MSKARARRIKLVLFDVDGVMTDGTIWLFPAPAGAQQATAEQARAQHEKGGFGIVSQSVIEAKGFHAHDGTAISLARLGGLKLGLITKRISETVALRAHDLRLEYVYQGAHDKISALEEILGKEGITAGEAAYVGDDIIDMPVMRRCGLAVAVANARNEVKREAHFITAHPGGHGAVRDAVEYILKAQGTWKRAVSEYICERMPERQQSAFSVQHSGEKGTPRSKRRK
jgi:3-deoxy-D-manno-octulosonate 8-phosphate phosphatase (KDO 8-P phosphatase)